MHKSDSDFNKPTTSRAVYIPRRMRLLTLGKTNLQNTGNQASPAHSTCVQKGSPPPPCSPELLTDDEDSYATHSSSSFEHVNIEAKSLDSDTPKCDASEVVTQLQLSEDLFSTEPDEEPSTPGKLSKKFSELNMAEYSQPFKLEVSESDTEATNIQPFSLHDISDEYFLPENDDYADRANVTIRRKPSRTTQVDHDTLDTTVNSPLDLNAIEADETSSSQVSIIVLSDTDESRSRTEDEIEVEPEPEPNLPAERTTSNSPGSVADSAYSNFVSTLDKNEFFENPPLLSTPQVKHFTRNFQPSKDISDSSESISPCRVPVTPKHLHPEIIPETDSEEEDAATKDNEQPDSEEEGAATKDDERPLETESEEEGKPEDVPANETEPEEETVKRRERSSKHRTQINFKIDMKLKVRGKFSRSSSSSEEPSPVKPKKKPTKTKVTAKPTAPEHKTPTTAPIAPTASFINEAEMKILNEVYGFDTWKTPTLVRKIKQKDETLDFKKFHSGRVTAFESTRLPPPPNTAGKSTEKVPKKSEASPDKSTNTGKTPQRKQVSDTSSTEFDPSDSDFEPDLIEESKPDYFSPPKKTPRPTRAINRPKYLDVCDTDTSDDDVVDNIEKKEPTNDASEILSKAPSKRKLFSHKMFDEEQENMPDPAELKEKRNARRSRMDEDISLIEEDKLIMHVPDHFLAEMNKTEAKKKPLKESNKEEKRKTLTFLQSLEVSAAEKVCHPLAVLYRQCYKTKKNDLATKLFNMYNEDVFDSKVEAPLSWNKKLTKTAGLCKCSKRNGRSARIELSEKVLTSADRLRCTLIHEMCHAAAWLVDGETGHGNAWRAWAAKANKVYAELPKINTCHQYEIEYKYTYQCKKCNVKSHAHSKHKKVENIRCRFCHGPIEILLNKADKHGNVKSTPSRKASGFAKFVKLRYKLVKMPMMTHAEVMKVLSNEYAGLTSEEKAMYN